MAEVGTLFSDPIFMLVGACRADVRLAVPHAGNGVEDGGAEALGAALKQNRSLVSLDLFGAHILPHTRSITSFVVMKNQVACVSALETKERTRATCIVCLMPRAVGFSPPGSSSRMQLIKSETLGPLALRTVSASTLSCPAWTFSVCFFSVLLESS